MIFLYVPSPSSPSISSECDYTRAIVNYEVHRAFFSVVSTEYVNLKNIHSGRTLSRIRLFQSARRTTKRAIHLGRFIETNKHKRIRYTTGDVFAGSDVRISVRARPLSPWLESRRQTLLSCRRDEIRYFVKVISPRKVSFRRVIASTPFLLTATALHATRAREEEKKEESKVHGEGPSRRQAG